MYHARQTCTPYKQSIHQMQFTYCLLSLINWQNNQNIPLTKGPWNEVNDIYNISIIPYINHSDFKEIDQNTQTKHCPMDLEKRKRSDETFQSVIYTL